MIGTYVWCHNTSYRRFIIVCLYGIVMKLISAARAQPHFLDK
jgi:hypothetical protein